MTPPLTDEQLKDMLAGCVGVSPGPWGSARWMSMASSGPEVGILFGLKMLSRDKSTFHTHQDASHIARCDPRTISSLITELLELRAERGKDATRREAIRTASALRDYKSLRALLKPIQEEGEE